MDSKNTYPNHTKTDIAKKKFLWSTSHRYVRYVCQIDTPVRNQIVTKLSGLVDNPRNCG